MSEELTKAVQTKELEILKEVEKACEQLGIHYMIAYGSLIGAMRHKGFIPWDDDMDIWMTRDDYDLFLAKGQAYLPENLFIQHITTEKQNDNLFIKVRDTNTLFLETKNDNASINRGIFIDVFPLERISGDPKVEFSKRKMFNMINGCYDIPYIKKFPSRAKRLLGMVIHHTWCRIVAREKFILREDRRRKAMHLKGGELFLPAYYIYSGTNEYAKLSRIKDYPYENTIVKGPEDADEFLRQIYGDYMQIPPIEKRQTHQPHKVVFDLKGQNKES